MNTVLCMKWGTRYGPEYVNKLASMVRRNLDLPHRFVCLTDDATGVDHKVECRPIPPIDLGKTPLLSPWKKIASFSPELNDLPGQILFLDVDLVITSRIDAFFTHPGAFCIIENWTQQGRGVGNSSVYRFASGGAFNHIFEDFQSRVEEVLAGYPNEQAYISQAAREVTFWPDSWCRSFKRHCLPGGLMNWFRTPRLPDGAKIVVFHGHPKPPEAARGEWPERPLKRIRPAPWINEYWH